MKLLKYLLFIFILLVQSPLHAQYRGAKNGVAARFFHSNYQFPLNDQFSENDFYGGVELEYTRHLNRFMNVSLPIKYARPLLPIEESGLKVLEGTVLETDLVFQFKYFREKGFIYPTLFAGFGGSIENWESYNYVADFGGNVVSFMNKIKFNIDQRLNFKAKVKAHQENNLFKVQETRLNYLRITKNAK